MRIKILRNKPDHALVQMGDGFQAELAVHFLKVSFTNTSVIFSLIREVIVVYYIRACILESECEYVMPKDEK
jgi:hypothetical protein